MAKRSDPIGVFDSGVGGISVLRALIHKMPGENYLYFGDSANAPYGTRTPQEVTDLACAVAEKLAQQGVKALVVACNTSTAVAMEKLKAERPDMTIVGIEPSVGLAAAAFPAGRIGVLATPATIAGRRFMYQAEPYPQVQIDLIPAPNLVEIVEAGKYDTEEADAYLGSLLAPYIGKLDALVLGCTHYPFVENALRRVMGEKVAFFDGSSLTAAETYEKLLAADLLNENGGNVRIENSSADKKLLELSMKLLGK
jgi:glutamate racemase